MYRPPYALPRLLQTQARDRYSRRRRGRPPQEPQGLFRAHARRDDEHHDLRDHHRLHPIHLYGVREAGSDLHDGKHPVRDLRGVPLHAPRPPRRRRQSRHPAPLRQAAPDRAVPLAGRGRDGHLRDTPVERLRRNLVLALALGAAVYLILAVLSDLGELAAALDNFDYALIPAILGLVALSYVGRFFRWTYYLRVLKVSVPTGINAAIFTSGLSMTISPGKLGEVLKSVFVRNATGAPIARTAPAVFAERATDGTGMVLWGFLGVFALDLPPWTMLIFLALAAFGIAVLRSKRLSLAAERILSKLPLVNRIAPHLRDFHGASNELLGARPLLVGTAISFFSWGLECAGVYLCAVGLGVDRPFLLIVFVFALSSLLGVLSMLPGGIGVVEAGLYGQFVAIANLSTGVAGALTLVIRLATLWFATLLGICGLLLVRRLLGDAPLEPHEQ